MNSVNYGVGDRVKRVAGGSCGNVNEGDLCEVIVFNLNSVTVRVIVGKNAGKIEDGLSVENFALIDKNTNNMSLINKFKLLTKQEPEKSCIKAGIMNMDETLTTEGRELFEAFMWSKYGDEFKTKVVDEILKDQEEK
jgi:hypothetical protein